MHWTKRLFGAVACVISLAGFLPAHALTLQPGNTATYNIDFTGQNPPPPYDLQVNVQFVASGIDAGDFATFVFFGGLNGSGGIVEMLPDFPVANLAIGGPVSVINFIESQPQFLDGVFSITITMDQGEFNIDSGNALGADNSGFALMQITGQLTTAVPEPGSLALMGGALVAVLALRRRAAS